MKVLYYAKAQSSFLAKAYVPYIGDHMSEQKTKIALNDSCVSDEKVHE